ncbi:MAG: hypothetical protein ACHQ01_08295 [Candidatus Limnocylindrales bacterium]
MIPVLDILHELRSGFGVFDAWRNRPRLRISSRVEHMPVYLGPVFDGPHGRQLAAQAQRPGRFAFIVFENAAERPQSDAVDISARLRFRNAQGRVLFEFPARWRSSKQVWQVGGDPTSIIDRATVLAGRKDELDVAFIYDDEVIAHGLNTEAQAYPFWQKAEWSLEAGAYSVEARVFGRNIRTQTIKFDLTVAPASLEFARQK